MLGLLGPLFPPVNPQNAQIARLQRGRLLDRRRGPDQRDPGVRLGRAGGADDARVSTAAVEVYEDRIGSLSVVEPSVLGVQVAYAGYFASSVIEAAGIKIIKTP